jgi:hypothetical protein
LEKESIRNEDELFAGRLDIEKINKEIKSHKQDIEKY